MDYFETTAQFDYVTKDFHMNLQCSKSGSIFRLNSYKFFFIKATFFIVYDDDDYNDYEDYDDDDDGSRHIQSSVE